MAWQGVRAVAEGVDDGGGAVFGELLDVVLGEGADHDEVEPPFDAFGDVVDGFADAEADFAGAEVDGAAAHLGHGDFERAAGAEVRVSRISWQGLCP